MEAIKITPRNFESINTALNVPVDARDTINSTAWIRHVGKILTIGGPRTLPERNPYYIWTERNFDARFHYIPRDSWYDLVSPLAPSNHRKSEMVGNLERGYYEFPAPYQGLGTTAYVSRKGIVTVDHPGYSVEDFEECLDEGIVWKLNRGNRVDNLAARGED